MAEAPLRCVITSELAGWRMDAALASLLSDWSRARIQKWIEAGQVSRHSGEVVCSVREKVKAGEAFLLQPPDAEPSALQPEAIPLVILHEDADLVVVVKPAGMTVHPGAGVDAGTLVHALLAHCRDLSGVGGVARPGIVHRLDKETSGILVVAKNDRAHLALSSQFANHSIERTYLAVVRGLPVPAMGKVDAPLGRHPVHRTKIAVVSPEKGRRAVTHYRLLRTFPTGGKAAFSLLSLELETGRTHQIRVHMAHLGHPLLGDPVYGRPHKPPASWPEETGKVVQSFHRQALHAARLGFIHPGSGQFLLFEAPVPQDFQRLVEALEQLG